MFSTERELCYCKVRRLNLQMEIFSFHFISCFNFISHIFFCRTHCCFHLGGLCAFVADEWGSLFAVVHNHMWQSTNNGELRKNILRALGSHHADEKCIHSKNFTGRKCWLSENTLFEGEWNMDLWFVHFSNKMRHEIFGE